MRLDRIPASVAFCDIETTGLGKDEWPLCRASSTALRCRAMRSLYSGDQPIGSGKLVACV